MSDRYAEEIEYHSRRVEQERKLARSSRSKAAKAIHSTLGKLHEMMRYDLTPG